MDLFFITTNAERSNESFIGVSFVPFNFFSWINNGSWSVSSLTAIHVHIMFHLYQNKLHEIRTHLQSFGVLVSPTTTILHPGICASFLMGSVGLWMVVTTIHLSCFRLSGMGCTLGVLSSRLNPNPLWNEFLMDWKSFMAVEWFG